MNHDGLKKTWKPFFWLLIFRDVSLFAIGTWFSVFRPCITYLIFLFFTCETCEFGVWKDSTLVFHRVSALQRAPGGSVGLIFFRFKNLGGGFKYGANFQPEPWGNDPNLNSAYGCFQKKWYPTTMGFPTKNDHFGVFWGYHGVFFFLAKLWWFSSERNPRGPGPFKRIGCFFLSVTH